MLTTMQLSLNLSIMHSYNFVILPFLLFSSLLLTLPNNNNNNNNNNFISVEATRKLSTSSNGGLTGVFKVDLIHRDSPLSPYYNSSMTRKERLERSPLGYISRGHKINLSSTYYNTSDLSTLIPNGGGYLMKIAIGTPPVDFFAVADTGSNLIWVKCYPCVDCNSFYPTKSSTFKPISCDAPACNKSDVTTGCPSFLSSDCEYQVIYGRGSSDGILSTETISLPSSDSKSFDLSSSDFGCAMYQTAFNDVDGIVGLGSGPSSLISQLGQKINHKFSYCLPPLNSKFTGKLALGADVSGPGIMSTPLTSGLDPTKYYVTLNSITIIGGDSIPVPSNSGMFLDSGTTLTYLPARVYGRVTTALEAAIGAPTTPSPGQPFDLCYSTDQELNSPKMEFNFERADVELSEINLFVEVEEGVICLAMAAASDDSTVIFGNVAQINFQVGYDLQAKQVSFAPTDCTTF